MTFQEKLNFLYISLPAMYGEDSVTIDTILAKAGITEVTPENIDSVIAFCQSRLERMLWQDNVGKQILLDLDG